MEAGSGQPTFRTAARGYDRGEVDAAVARLEAAVADTRARVDAVAVRAGGLEAQVARARGQVRDVARPSQTGLGAGVDRLLRLTEEQAGDVVQLATATATELEGRATVQARDLRDHAVREAAEWTATARREADELRESAGTLAEEMVAAATRTAVERLSAVRSHDRGRTHPPAQRQIEELTRQRDTVTAEIDRLRGILGPTAAVDMRAWKRVDSGAGAPNRGFVILAECPHRSGAPGTLRGVPSGGQPECRMRTLRHQQPSPTTLLSGNGASPSGAAVGVA